MPVEKLSISMEAALAKLVRSAAAEEGVSVSTWLTEAAMEKARQRALTEALDDFEARHGAMSMEQARKIVEESRKHSIVTRPKKKRP
jgi:hypothetical protein